MSKKNLLRFIKKNGAIDDWTFGPENLKAKYGCISFLQEIPVDVGEELFFSISLFKSKDDHDKVMSIIDKDPDIEKLHDQICSVIDLSKVVRGEFNRLV
jgi:uncharacterized protein YbaA (DUF1428 family)